MPITPLTGALTATVKVKDFNALVQAFNALEADHAALKAQLVKGDELRERLGALEAFVKETRLGLRAIFTVFHPNPDHDVEGSPYNPMLEAEAIHALLMEWIERVGGRLPLPQ